MTLRSCVDPRGGTMGSGYAYSLRDVEQVQRELQPLPALNSVLLVPKLGFGGGGWGQDHPLRD